MNGHSLILVYWNTHMDSFVREPLTGNSIHHG